MSNFRNWAESAHFASTIAIQGIILNKCGQTGVIKAAFLFYFSFRNNVSNIIYAVNLFFMATLLNIIT